ncbi:MAG: amidohydrolase [Clostridia bacterium]|nr:amidohydrolase [Clostridia bacterium]
MNKEQICALVEKHRQAIYDAEAAIWNTPETGFREWKTTAYMEKIFEDAGYTLTRAGNIPGFYTDLDTGRPGPKIMILAELDALSSPNHFHAVNGNAHACGHNAQCAAMVGIALALKEPGALDDMCGSIRLTLVPAEELIEIEYRESLVAQGVISHTGGKREFMARGFMDGVDIAFMFHTSVAANGIWFDVNKGANGCISKAMDYQGVAAHAGGSPHKGVNALYAATMGLQSINALRETFVDDEHVRVHPVITEGALASNIIPARCGLSTLVRGSTLESISKTNKKVNRALAAGALALGAQVHIHDSMGYAPLNNCDLLGDYATECMADLLGAEHVVHSNTWSCGSTDMGDMSCVMPVIHPHMAGAAGSGHGDDYYIADVELACVRSAEGQVMLANYLLSDNGERAKKVIESFTPEYPSIQAFIDATAAFSNDRDLVTYTEDGANIAF